MRRGKSLGPSGGSIEDWEEDIFLNLPYVEKIIRFYSAPIVKFTTHTLWHIIYLLLYCYVILFDLRPLMPTWREIFLYVWQLTFICEELRCILCYPGLTVLDKLDDWWHVGSRAFWSRLNTVVYLASIIGCSLRWSTTTFPFARLILVFNFIGYMVKLFKVYFVNSYLGPKVIMIKRMSWDVGMFVLVMIVFLFSYSVTVQALVHAGGGFYWTSIWDIFQRGIWEIFGEVNDDSMLGMVPGCEKQNGSALMVDRLACGLRRYPIPILLTIYLFFGNVLLINMLIAIFTHVFDDVQANSEEIWKYEMYWLVKEFSTKPLCPPPFIILEHLYLIIRKFWQCSMKKDKSDCTDMLDAGSHGHARNASK